MQSIVFTVRLTESEFDETTHHWRCPALAIPASGIREIYADGERVDTRKYRSIPDQAAIEWIVREVPNKIAVVIAINEQLTLESQTDRWKKLSIILPVIASIVSAGIGATGAIVASGKKGRSGASDEVVAVSPPNTSQKTAAEKNDFHWKDMSKQADWTGRDRAFSYSSTPKETITLSLCDSNNVGTIAVCWNSRTEGYPVGNPTDVSGSPSQWCTYKDSRIKIDTTPDGSAPPGNVFQCQKM